MHGEGAVGILGAEEDKRSDVEFKLKHFAQSQISLDPPAWHARPIDEHAPVFETSEPARILA